MVRSFASSVVLALLCSHASAMMGDYDETKLSKACDSGSAWSRPACVQVCRSIERQKRLEDLSRAGNGICRLALRTDEAKGFGAKDSACGLKNCVYKLRRVARKGPGVQGTYTGTNVSLDVHDRGSTRAGNLYIVATATTPRGRLVLEAECGSGQCGEFERKSGPAGKVDFLEGSAIVTVRR